LAGPKRDQMFGDAVKKLRRAVELPVGLEGSSEHPSHILNSLGTAYVRWAMFAASQLHDVKRADDLWARAFDAFEGSLSAGHGQNAQALEAFALRLIERAPELRARGEQEQAVRSAADALTLLDQAEDVLTGTAALT